MPPTRALIRPRLATAAITTILVRVRSIGKVHGHGVVVAADPDLVLVGERDVDRGTHARGLGDRGECQALPPPMASRNALPKIEVSAALMCSCSPLAPTRPALP